MTAEQLLLAISEIKEETVLVADRPSKRPVTHLWVAITAVAAAVVIGVLGYAGLLRSQQNKPPVGDSVPPVVTSAVESTTTTQPNGTGGDMNACTVHNCNYHNLDGGLLNLASKEEKEAYYATHSGEDFNVVTYVEYFGITREEFVIAMGWEEKLEEPAKVHHPRAPYTYGQFIEAIYGDDEELTAWVFSPEINTLL